MGHRMNYGKLALRDRMRRYGTEDARGANDGWLAASADRILAAGCRTAWTPRPPSRPRSPRRPPPPKTKAELRTEADAFLAWLAIRPPR